MDTLQYALRAILPLILEIALGCFLRRIGFLDAAFFQKAKPGDAPPSLSLLTSLANTAPEVWVRLPLHPSSKTK